MLLKRFFGHRVRPSDPESVNAASSEPVATAPVQATGAMGESGNVISLASAAGLAGNPRFAAAADEASDIGLGGEAPVAPARVAGIMSAPELQAFFTRGHFPSGRYHGGRYKTQQALELGKREIITDFQLLVSSLVDQRQAKRDRVHSEILKMQDFSAELAARLQLTSDHLDRQIAMLQEQFNLAEDGQGWVLAALNRYQLGFDRGVTDALDFDLLVA